MSRHRELKNAQARLIEAARALAVVCGEIPEFAIFWPVAAADIRALVEVIDDFDRTVADFAAAGGASARQTSIVAAVTTLPAKDSVRRRIVQTITAHHQMFHTGMTITEIKARLRIEHSTASAALNYVEMSGWVRDSGEKRLTQHRKPAIVWVPTDKAIAAVRDVSMGVA